MCLNALPSIFSVTSSGASRLQGEQRKLRNVYKHDTRVGYYDHEVARFAFIP